MPAALDGLPYGPMLIGSYLDTILYGVMVLQMFFYFRNYSKRDRPALRTFIVYLLFAETINTALIIAMLYQPLITNFGTPTAAFPLLLPSDAIMTVLISTPVQMFLAWRIKIISQSIWVALAISILAVISLAGGLWLGASVEHIGKNPQLHLLELRWPAATWLVASALADVALTCSLVFYLARWKSRSSFPSSDDLINKIIRMTVQTGLITALFALLDIAFFLGLPNSSINFIWDFSLSKLYVNALISTLNARASWGNLIDSGTPSSPTSQLAIARVRPDIRVRVQAQTTSTGDFESALGCTDSESQHKLNVFADGERRIPG